MIITITQKEKKMNIILNEDGREITLTETLEMLKTKMLKTNKEPKILRLLEKALLHFLVAKEIWASDLLFPEPGDSYMHFTKLALFTGSYSCFISEVSQALGVLISRVEQKVKNYQDNRVQKNEWQRLIDQKLGPQQISEINQKELFNFLTISQKSLDKNIIDFNKIFTEIEKQESVVSIIGSIFFHLILFFCHKRLLIYTQVNNLMLYDHFNLVLQLFHVHVACVHAFLFYYQNRKLIEKVPWSQIKKKIEEYRNNQISKKEYQRIQARVLRPKL